MTTREKMILSEPEQVRIAMTCMSITVHVAEQRDSAGARKINEEYGVHLRNELVLRDYSDYPDTLENIENVIKTMDDAVAKYDRDRQQT